MLRHKPIDLSSFFVVGVNYRKTDAAVRGRFAINQDQYATVITLAPVFDVTEFFILSTCNRTEIYGFAENAAALGKLLCSQTEGSYEDFSELAYAKSGREAITHLFNVAAGLDSQILGDYEIVGQIKVAFKFSKDRNCVGAYLERMLNEVLQASKSVRTNTGLSDGTVSVSFAAVQYIRQHFPGNDQKRVLLIGTGKIGSNTCKNLVDYLPGASVTLINRTVDKAIALAAEFNLSYDVTENLQACINEADVILVATNATEAIICKQHLANGAEKLIIDLSIPYNVSDDVIGMKQVTLVNVDELSKIKDETLLKRAAEIPKVNSIIEEHINSFIEWHDMRSNVPALKTLKETLHNIKGNRMTLLGSVVPEDPMADKIQKLISNMALKMRTNKQRGCIFIETINDFISPSSN
ncbi:MAG TPA: glutamyl-tRNA reductase [Ferruginibacter sp.]|nr:glutamyl-tRNA reductase [Ferruginibacter sp.]